MSERDLHAAVADFLTVTLSQDTWFTTIPLGGGGKARGGQLKRVGTKVGTPDILLCHAGRLHFIELKVVGGRVSDEQMMCHRRIKAAGGLVEVAWSVEDVRDILAEWEIPMRGRIAA